MDQIFKKEDKQSGDLNENIQDFLENYEYAAQDYKLDSVQQLRYLHNLFEADTKRFYQSLVLDKSSDCATAKQMMENK